MYSAICAAKKYLHKPAFIVSPLKYTTLTEQEKYTTIYKFPYIRVFSVINRLKLYQTVVTGISAPAAVILNQLEYISTEIAQLIPYIGVAGCLPLYGVGFLTTKFVGFIYYNEESDTVKVSYTNFWGQRKDIKLPRKDIIPLSELPYSPMDGLFLRLRRYSNDETMKINIKYGQILDANKFKTVL